MRLSIITINFNNREGLERTLRSISQQDFKDFDHIVIDGGSTDGSAEFLQKNSSRFAYWVSERDRGVYHAMNKGVLAAKGDYLLFLNSGDCLKDSALSHFFAVPSHADIIYANIRYVGAEKSYVQEYPSTIRFSFMAKYSLPHPATLIKRELFQKVGLYDEELKIAADWKFFIFAICRYGVTYEYKKFVAVDFDNSGMSSQAKNLPLIQSERERVLQEYFPFHIEDCTELDRCAEPDGRKEQLKKVVAKLGRSSITKFLFRFGWFKQLKAALK